MRAVIVLCWLFVMVSLAWLHDGQPKEEKLTVHFVLTAPDTVKPCTVEDDICWNYVRSKIGSHWWQGGGPLDKCFVPDGHDNCKDDVLEHN